MNTPVKELCEHQALTRMKGSQRIPGRHRHISIVKIGCNFIKLVITGRDVFCPVYFGLHFTIERTE